MKERSSDEYDTSTKLQSTNKGEQKVKMDIKELTTRVLLTYKEIESEQETKNNLIEPFFKALGYDIDCIEDIKTEVTCDFASKEKVDYEIMFNNKPIILVEAKKVSHKLNSQNINQLYRYFCAENCKLAILTNGLEYWFFSDFQKENIMDSKPFYKLNIIAPKESDKEILNAICKVSQCSYGIDEYIAELKMMKAFRTEEFAEQLSFIKFDDKKYKKSVLNALAKLSFQPAERGIVL